MLSASIDNRWQLSGDLELTLGLNGYYQGESKNFIASTSTLHQDFDSFWLVNGFARLDADSWYATLYAKNLADEEGVSGSFPCAYFCNDTGTFENWYGNGNREMITQPRTIGLKVGYKL
jgi:hypothetical protein